MPVVFFDIGNTLAEPVIRNEHLVGLRVFPEARDALTALQDRRFPLGIISNAGNELPETVNRVLSECGLLSFFGEDLIIYRKKDSPKVFVDAAAQAGVSVDQCVFVGENSTERSFALEAGFLRVAPHPKLALDAANGMALVYACIFIDKDKEVNEWLGTLRALSLVPIRVTSGSPQMIYVITTLGAVDTIRTAKIEVEVLGARDEPLQSDLYLLRDDRSKPTGFRSSEEFTTNFLTKHGKENLVVSSSEEGAYIALPSNMSIEQIPHFPQARHGHTEQLIADMALFNLFDKDTVSFLESSSFVAALVATLADDELKEIKNITADTIRQYHEPYIGNTNLDPHGAVKSRHIGHPDNKRVCMALERALRSIGGTLIISTSTFQARYPDVNQVTKHIEVMNIEAELPGSNPNSSVLITAHLDSTAAFGNGQYDPENHSAPGADDDASGIAAVLAIAGMAVKLFPDDTKRPKRNLRFVLFNAEEQGLIGSKVYARGQAAQQAKIAAVFQMDMIGYRTSQEDAPRDYEVHVGYPVSPEVENRSSALAQIIQSITENVSPNLEAPQIYRGANDPAAGRSDHASFNERGYAACVVSEDFFPDENEDPETSGNRHYHKPTDITIDYEFAADISRVVAAAALLAAKM